MDEFTLTIPAITIAVNETYLTIGLLAFAYTLNFFIVRYVYTKQTTHFDREFFLVMGTLSFFASPITVGIFYPILGAAYLIYKLLFLGLSK